MKIAFVLPCLITALLILSSCHSSNVDIDSVLSKRAENILLADVESTQNRQLLKKSVSVFVVSLDKAVPSKINEELHANLEKRVSDLPFFDKLVPRQTYTDILTEDPDLNRLKDEYLDIFTNVSVSNKDISVLLGSSIDVDNLIILQIDDWPCIDCVTSSSMRMKVRVVDIKTGLIIWTAFGEVAAKDIKESSELRPRAIQVSDDLIDEFFHTFKSKWHRSRAENLTKPKKT